MDFLKKFDVFVNKRKSLSLSKYIETNNKLYLEAYKVYDELYIRNYKDIVENNFDEINIKNIKEILMDYGEYPDFTLPENFFIYQNNW
jgi:hypothetical protein